MQLCNWVLFSLKSRKFDVSLDVRHVSSQLTLIFAAFDVMTSRQEGNARKASNVLKPPPTSLFSPNASSSSSCFENPFIAIIDQLFSYIWDRLSRLESRQLPRSVIQPGIAARIQLRTHNSVMHNQACICMKMFVTRRG